ncbi:MAG: hypothetical protein KA984_03750 [Candidatus Cloacimonetes bacterium]|nr:hypothetical protein [Candidatus Cloacimonadota bacterium]
MAAAQSLVIQTRIPLELKKTTYKLADTPIISNSEIIHADSLILISGVHYRLDYQNALLHLKELPSATHLLVSFILIPPELSKVHQRWKVQELSDSLLTTIRSSSTPLWGTDAKLDIKGSKTFAITFSDDDAFDLKQSLYVNLSGELAKNVNISAQLSDSQSKLSPEGDSKELSSLDQVFIKVFSNNYELAMGDLEWKFEGTRYIDHYSKFEGLNAWYRGKHFIQAAYTAGSGKSTSLLLSIIDGKQGPYYLRANEFQPGFIVVAGSEELYVDGSRWERGLDYYIDYAEGSVMFKKLIRSSNSVLIRFQYTDEYYAQSGFLSSSTVNLSSRLHLSHHLIWQKDDKQQPLLYDFSPADLDSLQNAGDNEAWGEGISTVEPGTGEYKRLQSPTGTYYYEYAPGDSLANYSINFSYVGSGNGDYEEFSSGKYIYRGPGLGSWIPQKRLIAPSQKANLDMALNYQSDIFDAGIEAIGTMHDRNTLSGNDDKDNLSGIIYAQGTLTLGKLITKLEHESRAKNSSLFGSYRKADLEYDFAALPSPDSLAQSETNLSFITYGDRMKHELQLRYKDIPEHSQQGAVRLNIQIPSNHPAWPTINMRNTFSALGPYPAELNMSLLQYHQLDTAWAWKQLKFRMGGLYNGYFSGNEKTIIQKLNPVFEYGNSSNILSQVSYTTDQTKLEFDDLETVNSSQSFSLRQILNSTNNRLDLDYTHRLVKQPHNSDNPKSNYDLINLRSSHNLLKQALSLSTNYSLNQTEFFPKIRELQYIGNGLGYYDSTGVSIPEGDYDYIYITSEDGSLSTEQSALLNLYFKPAALSKLSFFQRWRNDLSLVLSEQSTRHSDWRSYLFIPGYVYDEGRTIYGKQSLQHNLWLDLMRNHLNANLQLGIDRSLDQRYQSAEKSFSFTRALQLDIKGFSSYNTRLTGQWDLDKDSRYNNEINLYSLIANIQRNFSPQSNLQVELKTGLEKGGKQDGTEPYKLGSVSFIPSYRSVWMQKYRVNASLGFTYNWLSGSSYFAFLPQKRAGLVPNANLSAVYRLNSYSSLSLDYRFWDYPKDDARHELKLEFKAEL